MHIFDFFNVYFFGYLPIVTIVCFFTMCRMCYITRGLRSDLSNAFQRIIALEENK